MGGGRVKIVTKSDEVITATIASVMVSDSSRDEGPAVPLLLTMQDDDSAAEGAAQRPHRVM